MTYKQFLLLVTAHKKFKDFVMNAPIKVREVTGRHIGLENEKVFLSKDIGPGPEELEITNREIDSKLAVKEVFEALPKGINH